LKRTSKILLLFAIFNFFACTTQKSRSDVSGASKFYHNVTAEYNGYFNANVLLTESIAKLNEQHQDNYNKILPVYEYVAAENPQEVAGDLDKAIEKVSIVISIHRVSDWTDDCYLLIGQAQYLKKDYESAEETLEFLEAEFNPEILAKKKKKAARAKKKSSGKKKKVSKKKKKSSSSKANKKKRKKANKEAKKNRKKKSSGKKKKSSSSKKDSDKASKDKDAEKIKVEKSKSSKKEKDKKKEEKKEEKAEDKPPKKQTAYDNGLLWLARTYVERDNYERADAIFRYLEKNSKVHEDVKRDLAPARAHYYLKQKQYSSAINPLKEAVELADKKENKARYSFILAQLYQREGNSNETIAYHQKAIKYSRDYEMQFSARLALEKNAWQKSGGSLEDAVKRLEKLLKDIKNEEYRDLIYFTLADVALKNNKEQEAINFLKKSLATNIDNASLKAESYILLADLYYKNYEFINAKNYYDSTLMVLAETDERYENISRFSNNLVDIAKNLKIIEVQDSLLAISGLSDDEKLELAFKIKKERDKARLNALKEKSNQADDKFKSKSRARSAGPSSSGGSTPSTFFAYNDKSLKKGKRDFDKQWSGRKLEDDWRRSSKRGLGDFNEVAEILEDAANELTDDDVSNILKDIPDSPNEIQTAKNKIIDAMFALGGLYRDRLHMNEQAIEMLETLNRRFPGNKHELDSWYFLYLAHSDLRNISKAKSYYDKIISKYPDSNYAGVLQDPNYLENSKEAERKLTRYYDETYAEFTNGKYENASQRAVKAVEMFGPSNTLQPKFALLYAMCVGNLKGKDAYKKELQELIVKYPSTPEQIHAKEILRILGGRSVTSEDKDKIGGETLKKENETVFKVEDAKLHYFIVALKKSTIKLSDAKADVSDYNRQYHKLDKLRISNVYLGTDTSTPILVIRRFKTKELAMKYFDGITKNSADFLPEDTEYEMFAVTQYNYRQILKARSLGDYRAFFEENYR
jgi:tetratricopeptide (TPR) repeat protein